MTFRRIFYILLTIGLITLIWGYASATRDPIVRRASVAMTDWPAGAAPLRVVVISDTHPIDPDMSTERLRRIMTQINALRPDVVLIAGDLVSDRHVATRIYDTAAAIAPLAALRPRLATVAVLGNHDHWRKEEEGRRALRKAGIIVLDNDAVAVGPLVIGGLDDAFTDHDDPKATIARMRALQGAKLMLSHSPDPFTKLPRDIGLMVAGHTHCGQISLPLIGPLTSYSDYGNRYACGIIRERGKTLIVGAGLGTSVLPLRLGAPSDMWLLELGPVRSAAAR